MKNSNIQRDKDDCNVFVAPMEFHSFLVELHHGARTRNDPAWPRCCREEGAMYHKKTSTLSKENDAMPNCSQ